MIDKPKLTDRLNNIENIISTQNFRERGNSLGYYVFDYPPEYELIVREHLERLVRKINDKNSGFEIILFNIYEIIIQSLKDDGFLEMCKEMESENDYEYLADQIASVIDISNNKSPIISNIIESVSESSIVFITGVGSAYPIIRGHNVLNSLAQSVDTIPVVMFYPGKYSGQDFKLFGTLPCDNYYRAVKFPDYSGQKIE